MHIQSRKVGSVTILARIKNLLMDDIMTINRLIKSREEMSKTYLLLKSVVRAKKKMLNILPASNGEINEASSTPPKVIHEIHSKRSNLTKDERYLPKMLLQLEEKQMEHVRNAMHEDDMPSKVKQTLEKILSIYIDVCEQLKRNYKSAQLHPVRV